MSNMFADPKFQESSGNMFDGDEYHQQAEPDETLWQSMTGSQRKTPQMEQIPELQSSGILSTEDPAKVAAIAPVLLTTTDPNEMYKIIKQNFPEIHTQFDKDAAGNIVPILYNPKTQSYAMINKPGISGMDIMQTLGIGGLFAQGAALAPTVGAATGIGGLTSSAAEFAQSQLGGEFNAGQVVSDALLEGAGRGIENIMRARTPSSPDSPITPAEEALDFAKEQNVTLRTSDVIPPKTFTEKAADVAASRIPITGTQRVLEKQAVEREDIVERYVGGFDQYSPDVVYKSLQDQGDKLKSAAGDRRQRIVNSMTDVEVITPSSESIKRIDDEINRLSFNPNGTPKETIDQSTVDQLTKYKNDLINDPTFGAVEKLRTDFRTNVKGDRNALPSTSEAAINRIYDGFTKDMDDAVTGEFGAQTARKWKQANRVFAERASELKNTRLKSVLEKGEVTPELVDQMLFDKRPSQIRLLYKSLDSTGKQAARSGLISKAMEKSKGVPTRFLNELNKLEKQTGIFFRGKDRKILNGIKNYLEHTRKAPEASVMTQTGQQNYIWGVPAMIAADVKTTGGVGTAAALTYGLTRQLYESAPVRDLLMAIGSTPRGSTESLKLFKKLEPMITGAAQGIQKTSDKGDMDAIDN